MSAIHLGIPEYDLRHTINSYGHIDQSIALVPMTRAVKGVLRTCSVSYASHSYSVLG